MPGDFVRHLKARASAFRASMAALIGSTVKCQAGQLFGNRRGVAVIYGSLHHARRAEATMAPRPKPFVSARLATPDGDTRP